MIGDGDPLSRPGVGQELKSRSDRDRSGDQSPFYYLYQGRKSALNEVAKRSEISLVTLVIPNVLDKKTKHEKKISTRICCGQSGKRGNCVQ